MSQTAIRKALEKHLSAMSPSLSTAFENVPFTPVTGVAYQRVNLLPNAPDNSAQGSGMYFDRGIFQVTLCYPQGTGPAAAEARAQMLRDWFRRATTMVEGDVSVIVTTTPRISRGEPEGDRFCIPVSVSYQAQINVT